MANFSRQITFHESVLDISEIMFQIKFNYLVYVDIMLGRYPNMFLLPMLDPDDDPHCVNYIYGTAQEVCLIPHSLLSTQKICNSGICQNAQKILDRVGSSEKGKLFHGCYLSHQTLNWFLSLISKKNYKIYFFNYLYEKIINFLCYSILLGYRNFQNVIDDIFNFGLAFEEIFILVHNPNFYGFCDLLKNLVCDVMCEKKILLNLTKMIYFVKKL